MFDDDASRARRNKTNLSPRRIVRAAGPHIIVVLSGVVLIYQVAQKRGNFLEQVRSEQGAVPPHRDKSLTRGSGESILRIQSRVKYSTV